MTPGSVDAIDVGGDRYFIGNQKGIKLGFKNAGEFVSAFKIKDMPDNDLITLMKKYFPFGGNYKKIKYTSKDLEIVKKIINHRINGLPLKYNNLMLTDIQNHKHMASLKNIKQFLDNYVPRDDKKHIQAIHTESGVETVRKMTDERRFQLIVMMAWYLIHPHNKAISDDVRDAWLSAISKLDTLTVGDMIGAIKSSWLLKNSTLYDKYKNNPLELLKVINIEQFAGIHTNELPRSIAIDVIGANSDEYVNHTLLKNRLDSIMKLLVAKKYVNKNEIGRILKSLNGVHDTDTINIEKDMIPKINTAISPIFTHLKYVYGNAYQIINDFSIHDAIGKSIDLGHLTNLVHFANNWNTSKHGIIRLDGVTSSQIQYLESFVKFINEQYEEAKKVRLLLKNEFTKELDSLPSLSINKTDDDYNIISFVTLSQLNLSELHDPDNGQNNIVDRLKAIDRHSENKRIDADIRHGSFGKMSKFFEKGVLYAMCYKKSPDFADYPHIKLNLMSYNISKMPPSIPEDQHIEGEYHKIGLVKNEQVDINSIPFYLDDITGSDSFKNVVFINDAMIALSTLIKFKNIIQPPIKI